MEMRERLNRVSAEEHEARRREMAIVKALAIFAVLYAAAAFLAIVGHLRAHHALEVG